MTTKAKELRDTFRELSDGNISRKQLDKAVWFANTIYKDNDVKFDSELASCRVNFRRAYKSANGKEAPKQGSWGIANNSRLSAVLFMLWSEFGLLEESDVMHITPDDVHVVERVSTLKSGKSSKVVSRGLLTVTVKFADLEKPLNVTDSASINGNSIRRKYEKQLKKQNAAK